MSSILRFDHVVLGTPDIAGTAAIFERLGFDVYNRGEPPSAGIVNRLVRFDDNSFIELVAFVEPSVHRFHALIGPKPAWIAYAAVGEDLGACAQALDDAGVPHGGCKTVSQSTPALGGWTLELLVLGITPGDPRLPFLVHDQTPVARRVPPVAAGRQPFGIHAIRGLTLAAPDLLSVESALRALGARRGDVPVAEDAGLARAVRYDFGEHWVDVWVSRPTEQEGDAARVCIRDVTLACGSGAPPDVAQRHQLELLGIRLEVGTHG